MEKASEQKKRFEKYFIKFRAVSSIKKGGRGRCLKRCGMMMLDASCLLQNSHRHYSRRSLWLRCHYYDATYGTAAGLAIIPSPS